MHEEIDLLGQISSELFRIKRLKRTLGHLLEWNEKSGLAVDDDFFDPADGTGDDGGFARHRFEIDNAKRLVNGGTTKNGRVRVELNHTRLIEHLIDPDDAVTQFPRPRHRCLHFLGDFFCIGGTGAKHDLKILIHELDRAHEVNDPLLARDSANEKYERLRAIDPESVE